jgi:hypothetical protein
LLPPLLSVQRQEKNTGYPVCKKGSGADMAKKGSEDRARLVQGLRHMRGGVSQGGAGAGGRKGPPEGGQQLRAVRLCEQHCPDYAIWLKEEA